MATKLPKEVNRLIDEVTNEDHESLKPGTKLRLGNIFLYLYDAKHKAKLDVWDQLPLVVLLDIPDAKYILGINLHYIPWAYRLKFVKNLQSKGMKIKYADVAKAWKASQIPAAYANLAIRKYLISHIRSNIKVFESAEDQYEIVKNVLPDFQKKQMAEVYKEINNKVKRNREKNKSK